MNFPKIPIAEKAEVRINREKTCPLLLRVFCSNCEHNRVSEYARGNMPSNELQVYTWLNASLKELSLLIRQINVESRRRGTQFKFAIVSPENRSSGYRMRDIGTVCSGFPSDMDRIMLKDCSFRIGDMLDVAITPVASSKLGTSAIGLDTRRFNKSFLDQPGVFPPHIPPSSTAAMMSLMTAAANAQHSDFDGPTRHSRNRGYQQRGPYNRPSGSRRLAQY